MKSRILNVSPRAYLRQKDSKNVIPAIVRTGNQNETGKKVSPFSENDGTIIFDQNKTVLAPYMIPKNIASLSGFLTGSLLMTGSINPGAAYLDKKITEESIYPFKESYNLSAYNKNFSPGFPAEVYPDFSSPDSDKAALFFNIGTNSNFDVIKVKKSDTLKDAAGPFLNQGGSGFIYYNHEERTWEDVGNRDPSSGTPIEYDPVFQIDETLAIAVPAENKISSGQGNFLSQFSSSPYSITSEGTNFVPKSKQILKTRGYDKIGEPTSFFEAPYAPRYHAPTGSSISLSSLISDPFVVDRISVSIPITLIRTQDVPTPVGPGRTDDGFGRDIDNHVFFVYVQNRSNASKDSVQDVSSSIRYLIAKESFCSFNKNTFDLVEPDLKPFHSFASITEFQMGSNIASSSKAPITLAKDVDLLMTFRPATFDRNFGTVSKLAGRVYHAPATFVTGSVFVQNFWRGGQYASGSSGEVTIPSPGSGNYRNINRRQDAESPTIESKFCKPSSRALISSFWEQYSETFTSGSGLGEVTKEINTSSTTSATLKLSPIVLFPGDELVFGIESGANSNMVSPGRTNVGTDKSVLSVTGSRLVIRQGDANVVLYGTMMTNAKERLPVLNQHLGSDAVQEDIHDPGPFDQFDIYDKKILSASYVDGIFAGKMIGGTRKRVALGSKGESWITGSLQRNIRLVDNNTIYYDSYLPPPPAIVSMFANASADVRPIVKFLKSATNGFAFENNRNLDTLLKRKFTFESEITVRHRSLQIRLVDATIPAAEDIDGDTSRFVLFYNGINPSVEYPSTVTVSKKSYRGAASIRYGLISARLTSPAHVFSRNSYGQFRDLIEQPKMSRFVSTETGKDAIEQPFVIASFVSASTDTPVEPSSTQCSNLSAFCTSSVPFSDNGRASNRGALPDAQNIQFGPNNLIFGNINSNPSQIAGTTA
jgi:hypothetical protein